MKWNCFVICVLLLLGVQSRVIAQFIAGIVAHPVAGADADVAVIFEKAAGTQFGASSLYFRRGGLTDYQSVPLTGTGDTLHATIPAGVVTPSGIECFVHINNLDNILAAYGPIVLPVDVPLQTYPLALTSRAFKMISIPLELRDPLPASVLKDSYGEYNQNNWRLFRWQGTGYAEYPGIARTFIPGTAFWLVTGSGGAFEVKNARSVPTLQPAYVQLDTGWNQIADPYVFPVTWDAIANSDKVSPPYYYNGAEFVVNATVLNPWEGYFVRNPTGSPLTLVVPPVQSGVPLGKTSAGIMIDPEKDFQIQVSAESSDKKYRDTFNYVGFKDGATTGEDSFDYEDPPPVADGIQLSVVDGGRRFMTNFKPIPPDGDTWRLLLSSTVRDIQVNVTIRTTGHLAEGMSVYVLDLDNGNTVAFGSGSFTAILGKENDVRSFKILVGDRSFVEHESNGIPLVPLEYALDQNYPNPFNPSTTIQYVLARRGNVSLQVYNTLGQLVATPINEEQPAGHHEVRFDAGSLASGIYFYRLVTAGFEKTRKFVLLR